MNYAAILSVFLFSGAGSFMNVCNQSCTERKLHIKINLLISEKATHLCGFFVTMDSTSFYAFHKVNLLDFQ